MSQYNHSRFHTIEYIPMTSPQKWLMGEMLKFKRPGWATIEFLVKTKVPMNEVAMQKAVDYLLEKYENLRVRIINKDGQWIQELNPMCEVDAFAAYDLSSEGAQIKTEKVKQICSKTRDWLLPKRGNLVKILFFKFSEQEGRIWFCIHHVISDFMSVILFSNEFMMIYNSIIQGRELKPTVVKDYRKWLYLVEGYSRDVLLPSELEYWISLPWDKAKILPSDYPSKFYNDDIIADAINNKKLINTYRTDTHWMQPEETFKLISRYGNEFESILLATFFLAIAKQKDLDWIDINVSYSARNTLPADYGLNVSRLLGFLATVRAVLLNRPTGENVHENITDVVKQINSIPNAGIGFYLIADHIKDEQLKSSYLNSRRDPGILFNYLGRVDANATNEQYELVEEDAGKDAYISEIRNILIDCVVGIKKNKLYIEISYTPEYFKVSTIDEIVQSMMGMLKEIAFEPEVPASSDLVLSEV